jgi:hypothetical protein
MARLPNPGVSRKRRGSRGSAALEVLMLIPFIVLIWMLIVNMGYNGFRERMAQAALRMGAFQFVTAMSTMNRQESAKAVASMVNQAMFSGENDPAKFSFSGQSGLSSEASNAAGADLKDEQGLLSKASSRETVTISVARNPPYADLFPRTDLQGSYIVASNTWTYCEMKDKDNGAAMQALNALNEIGKYGLWLFGGCGGKAFDLSCDDRCPG